MNVSFFTVMEHVEGITVQNMTKPKEEWTLSFSCENFQTQRLRDSYNEPPIKIWVIICFINTPIYSFHLLDYSEGNVPDITHYS